LLESHVGDVGMTILSNDVYDCAIYFGDQSDNNEGSIRFNNTATGGNLYFYDEDHPSGAKLNDLYGPTYVVTDVKTTDYNANFNEVVRCNPSGGAFTVFLPDPNLAIGKTIVIKNVTNSTLTIIVNGDGADQIDGQATVNINEGYKSLTLVSYGGSDWGII
jgi:hypothetical protein